MVGNCRILLCYKVRLIVLFELMGWTILKLLNQREFVALRVHIGLQWDWSWTLIKRGLGGVRVSEVHHISKGFVIMAGYQYYDD